MNEEGTGHKRPFGFYVCVTTYSLERAAYYASKFLIYFFVSEAILVGGLGLDKAHAALLQSFLVAFTYLAPIFGGIVGDRFLGARYCVPIGMFIMAAGYFIGSIAHNVIFVYIMIALVSIGTGFFKGNVSALNGTLFKDKEQLDSAFSLQYSFVNAGALVGTFFVGILYLDVFEHDGILGFSQCFALAAAICLIGGLWFIIGCRWLGDAGKKPFKAGITAEKVVAEKVPLTKVEKNRIVAIALVSAFSVIFWIFWNLTYLAAYDYGAAHVNLFVDGFEVPLSWFDTLNSLTCIALGPILAVLWLKLSKRPTGDISLFKKTAIGLALLGAAFYMLVFAEVSRGIGAPDTEKASLIWIILFAMLLSLGEMFFSPLGNSFVSKYAPKSMLSVLMGVWIIASFFAGLLYGPIYAYTLNFPMIRVYIIIPIILFTAAAALFILNKKLTLLLGDKELAAEEAAKSKA